MRLRFGDCVLDSDTRELFRKDKPVHLQPKAFRLLELLIENRPRALSKEELHGKVWPGTFVSEATLASAISDIRAVIGDAGHDSQFIRTVHGYGYAFAGQASEAGPRPAALGNQEDEAYLVWEGAEAVLPAGESTIGRGAGVSVCIDDRSLSRWHARITVSADGAVLDDLGSKNGTFLGDSRVIGSRDLMDGDEIRLGSVQLVFRRPGSCASTSTLPRALDSKGSATPKRLGISRRKVGKGLTHG